MTLEVITFGCRLNTYESELIKSAAIKAGLENTIIFNSCSVTSEAERQLGQAIRKSKKNNPQCKIIVTGCAAQTNAARYAAMTEVDLVLGNEEKTKSSHYSLLSTDYTEKVIVNDIMSIKETASQLIEGIEGRNRAFIQVQNGCNHRCTYCSIPFARGNNRSVPIGEIVAQTAKLLKNGYQEIVLTGVDITDYGLDLPGTPTLGQMMRRLLANLPELQRLRLSSIDVAEIDQDLIQLIANEPRLMPHFHLSLQSGDNLILKRMKRRHNREQVIDFCNQVRSLRPDAVFGADIITGFPTESEEMFQNTYNLIEEAQITYLHVFPYSEREDTPAARMPAIAVPIRKSRAKRLRELGKQMQFKHFKSQVGKVINLLLENSEKGYADDFSLVKLVSPITEGTTLISAKITSYTENYLIGEKINTFSRFPPSH